MFRFMKMIFFFIVLLGLSGTAYGKLFTDSSGQTFEIYQPFKRIISLYAAHTENLFDLGLDKEIIGVTPYEIYPPQALEKPVFSYHDDPEKIISAKPDLVLIRPMIARNHPEFVQKLRQAGISVISIQPVGLDDLYEYWRTLGMLADREENAEIMIRDFRRALRNLRTLAHTISPAKRKRVYFESIHKKMKTFASDSIQMFVLTMAGGINLANDAQAVSKSNIAMYGKDRILSLADEIDVYLAQKGKMNHTSIKKICQESGFDNIKAVKNEQVFVIEEHLISRPTRRLIQGAVKLGNFLYPDIYTEELWGGLARIMFTTNPLPAISAYKPEKHILQSK